MVSNNNKPKVLIVEDDVYWQQILSEILLSLNFHVETTDNVDKAISLIRDSSHQLVMVDLSLNATDHRNKDGVKILEAINKFDPNAQSILLTGHATVELAVQVMNDYQALTCLRKEMFKRSEFRDLLENKVLTSFKISKKDDFINVEEAEISSDQTQTLSPSHDILKGKAIVVDDDAGWRLLLSELVSDAGYVVQSCSGYGEALGMLNNNNYELAIIDLSLEKESNQTKVLKESSSIDENYSGGRLLINTRALGIPTIVVSGIVKPIEINNLYENFGVLICIEKQNFDRNGFLDIAVKAGHKSIHGTQLDNLSQREKQVLSLLMRGMINQEIADTMMISVNTVKRHLKSIYKKIGVSTRSNAVSIAIKSGLVPG